ncbi:uncharacterized protein LOC106140830 [Amyelois transitella]|uniref:uncharacterized protein LOC106140830 n=1 Tax=Amyelois transitella TaxID=680683 RepID=UPI00298F7D57|nr:uncharacterized protein LOC106140830 [Amyelois transitella]
MWLSLVYVLVLVYGGGGVTKTSGISKFWTDDYKVFEQVYGKTSDRDLYGATLPASVSHIVDNSKKKVAASEKKERYIDTQSLSDLEGLSDSYANQYTKVPDAAKAQPATSTFNFVSYSDFKPISQQSDPETYNYLKHLEQFENEQKQLNEQSIEYPKGVGGFKPYLSYSGGNPEDSDAYKSIQDILDAHEANKVNKKSKSKKKEVVDDDDISYTSIQNRRKKPKVRQVVSNYVSSPKCYSGRCRKRSNNLRPRSRPYIRKIKRIVGY